MKGTRGKFTEQDVELIRERLFRKPQVVQKEVTGAKILTLLQELRRAAPGQHFPEVSLCRVQRVLRRRGWSWGRTHRKRMPDVDRRAAVQFVWRVLFLMTQGAGPSDIINADETVFLLYPHGSYTW
jgi:hypothetical protein